MTAAIVLKPDFAGTFTRGLAREAGTILGLVVASGVVYATFGVVAGQIALVGVCTFVIRALGLANYALSVIAVTALVVVLTSLAGAHAEATIIERGLYTLAGGALALLAYAAWPTWERTQTPARLADLLDAYRHYFAAVTAAYLHPERRDQPAIDTARRAARLARSNAEASVDRLRAEPARSTAELDRAESLLAGSHRFVHSVMGLEAGLYAGPAAPAPAALRAFVSDADRTLGALAVGLRHPHRRSPRLPDLHADQRTLAAAALQSEPAERPGYPLPAIAAEVERIATSLNTLAQILQNA